jgi:hypothetical protein
MSTVAFSYSFKKSAFHHGLLCSSGASRSKTAAKCIEHAVRSAPSHDTEPKSCTLERRTMTAAYYCYPLKDKLKPTIRTKGAEDCPSWSLSSTIMPVHILHKRQAMFSIEQEGRCSLVVITVQICPRVILTSSEAEGKASGPAPMKRCHLDCAAERLICS